MQTYLSQLSALRHNYTKHVKTHLRPIYDDCLAHSANLNDVNQSHFNSNDNILAVDDLKAQELDFLYAIGDKSLLTSRESQCLLLYSQGLTAKQTARRLGLSHRTIEDHFEQIKLKYGVHHKRDLLFGSLPP